MKRALISLLLFPLCLLADQKSSLLTESDFPALEKEYQALLTKHKTTNEEKFYLHSLIARELLGLGHYKKSLELYERALKAGEKESVDKAEAYYNILFLKWKLGQTSKELEDDYKNMVSALGDKADKPLVAQAVAHWKSVIFEQEKLDESVQKSFYGAFYSQNRFEKLVKEKKYSEALALMPAKLDNANITLKLQKDMMRSLVFPKSDQALLCEKTLKKYPNSISYTMQVCKYLKNRKSVSLESIEKQIRQESDQRLYWVSALKDLK